MNTDQLDFSWKTSDLASFLPIILALAFFSLYWFVSKSERIKLLFTTKYERDAALFNHLFFTKIIGFVSMGIFPVIICLLWFKGTNLSDYGISFDSQTFIFSLVWTVGLSILVIPIAYFSAKKPKNLVNYPQARSKVWTKKMMLLEALAWFLYLFGYELLFRGVLLFPVVDAIGIWPAIAVNVALYSATHIPKGLDETIGAIPLGFVLCILSLMSGNIIIAFVVHVVMAWTNTFTALHYNPEMNYATKK